MPRKILSAGVQQTQLLFLDNSNIAIGNATTAIVAGDIRGAYNMQGIQTAPSGNLEGEGVGIDGDDSLLGTIIFPSADPREVLLEFGQGDIGLDSTLQGTLIEQLGAINIALSDPAAPQYPTVCVIHNSRAINRDVGNSGRAAWKSKIYPVIQLQPLEVETLEGRTAASFRYKGVIQQAFNHPWGVTLSNAVNGNLSAFSMTYYQDYPITIDAFRGNGVKTNWVLAKTPVDTNNTWAFVERVLLPLTSVTPATNTIVTTGAAADNARGVVIYGYTGS